jgi:hypothetical protein
MSLVLAVVYSNYRRHQKADIKRIVVQRVKLMEVVTMHMLEAQAIANTLSASVPSSSSSSSAAPSGPSRVALAAFNVAVSNADDNDVVLDNDNDDDDDADGASVMRKRVSTLSRRLTRFNSSLGNGYVGTDCIDCV